MVEVLIAGAGPAGALAALILARAGVRVLVVDRARFPRDKLCGDTLNPGALRVLARHGAADGVAARGLPIAGMLLTSGTGVRVRGLYGRGVMGRSLVRRDLDQMLIEAAVAAGAQFQEEVRVAAPMVEEVGGQRRVRGATLVTREGRTLRVPALVTIAADGRRSALAFALGLARQPVWPRRWAIGGYMTDVESLDSGFDIALDAGDEAGHVRGRETGGGMGGETGRESGRESGRETGRERARETVRERVRETARPTARLTVGEMHIRRGHYIGVAPLPGGLTNVCYVSPSRRELAEPARVLLAQLRADPLLRDRLARARLVGPVTMMGPLAVDVPVAGMPGLLLAGDAAGFVDPMTGDGLRFALRGAELAARVAQQTLEGPGGVEAPESPHPHPPAPLSLSHQERGRGRGGYTATPPMPQRHETPREWLREAEADERFAAERRAAEGDERFTAGRRGAETDERFTAGRREAEGHETFTRRRAVGEPHEMLTAWRAREFSRKYWFNRSVRALVSSDYGVRAGTLGARLAPAVLRRIIRYAGDEGGSSDRGRGEADAEALRRT